MFHIKPLIIAALSAFAFAACSGKASSGADSATSADNEASSAGSAFSADSAFAYLKAQTDMGPRVPGTVAHDRCASYLESQLKTLGADTVVVQRATLTAYNGDRLPIANILGRFNADAQQRILLLAHWDSRPWADNATDSTLRRTPIDGANDGASGVAVLLEVARNLGLKKASTGVDLLFVDAEDYGRHADDPADPEATDHDSSWAMGTQYWAASNPYANIAKPQYAILLDMVGGRNARFYQEYFSRVSAPAVVDKVWARASQLGLGSRFPAKVGGAVTDDHVYINRMGIPAIDIIEIAHPYTGSFNPTWHTPDDNISNIDPSTLGAVGTLVLDLVYKP